MYELNTEQAINVMKKGKHVISNYKRIYFMDKDKNIKICDENKNFIKIVDQNFFMKLSFIKFMEIKWIAH